MCTTSRIGLALLSGLAGVTAVAGPFAATASAAGAPVTVAPGAAGPPVTVVWRSGRTIRGSAADGSGARRLVVLRHAERAAPMPSPDGRRVAFVAGDRLFTLDLDGAGGLRERGRVTIGWTLRWSPDGTRIAVIDPDGLAVCAATDAGPPGCPRWTDELSEEGGGSWSPDGTRVAIVRDDLAVVTYEGRRVRVVERHPFRGGGYDVPGPAVWTRAGLTWSTLRVRLRDGELAGVGRVRVRRQEGAAVRTVATIPQSGRTFIPFAAGGELADGTILGVRYRVPRVSPTAALFDLRLLRADGRVVGTPVSAGPFEPGMGNVDAQIAGTLADGRVALIVRGSECRAARLYLAHPARGLGRRVALGDEIGVAAALPGNPTTS